MALYRAEAIRAIGLPGDLFAEAMLELGRAQKAIFIARYLRDRDLQREIEKA